MCAFLEAKMYNELSEWPLATRRCTLAATTHSDQIMQWLSQSSIYEKAASAKDRKKFVN
jgi:hypothetical protein